MNAVIRPPVSLDAVVRTQELANRPSRAADYEVQSDALTSLSRSLAESPHTVLEMLCTVAQKVCGAGSAGVSLLSPKEQDTRFFWPAITGAWREQVGGGTPREFGPCGIVLERDCTQLFARPERYYPYMQGIEPIIEEVLLAPFYVAGKAVGTVWVLSHDPTRLFDSEDQRQLESLAAFASGAYQVIKSIEGLEEQIGERKRAEQGLIDANQRKDEFLAMLAHELRNPLAPIRNAAQLLGFPNLKEDALTSARQVIQRQVKHMARLLDDLLDIARVTQGKLELKREATSLTHIIDSAVEAARPLIDSKHQRLAVSLPSQMPVVDGDAMRLSQVVSNLLTNAAKYTDAGGRIELSGNVDGDTLCLTVTDDGIGIEPESLERIFTMFSQVEASRSRSEGGLGIGLALVKGLISLHGGTIEARSSGSGRGSEFTVRLPIVVASPSPVLSAKNDVVPKTATRRILIAEDNKDAAESLAMLLTYAGHEVRTARSGNTAFSLAQSFRPEVALLDIGMPGLNGYELARALRSEPWGSGIRLIAMTGWGQEEDKNRARSAGFDHHLTKPVDLDVLGALLFNLGESDTT